jgi:hypothetical protein
MVDGLAAVDARVHDQTETFVATEATAEIGCGLHEFAKELAIAGRRKMHQIRVMPYRHHEHVHRRLWIDIFDRDDVVIAIDALRRYFACGNLAEDAFGCHVTAP